MATRLAVYDSDDNLITSANPIPLSWVGTTPAGLSLKFYNDRDGDGADDAIDRYLITKWRVAGTGDQYVNHGLPPADDQYLEGRITGVALGTLASIASTAWEPLGRGSGLVYPTLASGDGFVLEVRPRLPPSALTEQYEFLLVSPGPESMALGSGFSETAGADGILSGLGKYWGTGVWAGSASVQDTGGASEFIQTSEISYQINGVPYARAAQEVDIYGVGAALTAGQSRYSLVSLPPTEDPDDFTVTAGVATSSPLTAADIPDTPTDEIAWDLVRVEYDAGGGNIESDDVTHLATLTGFAPSDAGATRTRSGGWARVNNAIVRRQASQSLAIPLSSTNVEYMRATGNLTDEAEPGALLMGDGIVTDGSAITNSGTDRRHLVGHTPVEWLFHFNAAFPAGTQYAYAQGVPSRRNVYLLPLDPVMAWIDSLPTGGASGFLIWDVEYSTAGGAWTSIFTGSGTRDLRPAWAHNAVNPFGFAKAATSAELLSASGWTSTDWTGSFAAGWDHTTGNVSVLSNTLAAVVSTDYLVTYTVSGRTAGSFTLAFGGSSSAGLTATGTFRLTASTTGNLTVTPTSDFDGAIVLSIVSTTTAPHPEVRIIPALSRLRVVSVSTYDGGITPPTGGRLLLRGGLS